MGLHQAPTPPSVPDQSRAQVHFHFYPPLLRSASVRKFLVGFEMMGEAQVSVYQKPQNAGGLIDRSET
jgi:UDPglucose--hexose-1-phosphate uridylyltransferase